MLHAASQQIFTAFREHHDEQRRATNNFLLTVCETASRKTCFQSASKKLSSGGLVRSRPPLAQAAGGNDLPCSSKFSENLTRRRHFACLRSTLELLRLRLQCGVDLISGFWYLVLSPFLVSYVFDRPFFGSLCALTLRDFAISGVDIFYFRSFAVLCLQHC